MINIQCTALPIIAIKFAEQKRLAANVLYHLIIDVTLSKVVTCIADQELVSGEFSTFYSLRMQENHIKSLLTERRVSHDCVTYTDNDKLSETIAYPFFLGFYKYIW